MSEDTRYNKALPYMNKLEILVGMEIDDFNSMMQYSYERLQNMLGKSKLAQAELLLDQVSNILWGE
jgi:hypothetical protein